MASSGLMDGSLSTLAPIFAVALATHRPLTAFYRAASNVPGNSPPGSGVFVARISAIVLASLPSTFAAY